MLTSVIKRTVNDGRNSVKYWLFYYRNKDFLANVWKLVNESLGEGYQPISTPKITATNVLFFKGENISEHSQIICKIPLDNEAELRAQHSFTNIQSLHSAKSFSSNFIPLPIKIIASPYGKIFIESLFVGSDGQEVLRSKQTSAENIIHQGINAIKEIQDRFPQYPIVFGEEKMANFIEEIKHNFSSNGIEDDHHEKLVKLLMKVRYNELIFGFSHGDYWLGNIILNQNKLVGIIDWDRFRLDHPVIYDRMHLDIFYRAMSNGWSLGEEIISRYKQNPTDDLILYWCYFLKNSMNSNPLITKNKRWLEKNYFRVIQNLS
jgi:hypothetical protein